MQTIARTIPQAAVYPRTALIFADEEIESGGILYKESFFSRPKSAEIGEIRGSASFIGVITQPRRVSHHALLPGRIRPARKLVSLSFQRMPGWRRPRVDWPPFPSRRVNSLPVPSLSIIYGTLALRLEVRTRTPIIRDMANEPSLTLNLLCIGAFETSKGCERFTRGKSKKPLATMIKNPLIGLALATMLLTTSSLAEEAIYPLRVSENGRYFVDQKGRPVFWLGTTQWQLFRDYKVEDARTILEKTKSHGFAFAQVMLLGVGDGTKPNVYGEKPWASVDPLTPNEAYFKHVDAVLNIARENNLVISLTLFHQRWRKLITEKNARSWAKWLAQRYQDQPAIVWSMTPEAKPEFVPVLRELAAGLRDGDGGSHLITFKPDPAPYSSSFIHGESWLDFNSMQTWKSVELIHAFVTKDYSLKPVKPVLMAEGAYEHGSEYGFEVTPLWIRRQAYYSYLAGAHHTYGHNDSWRVLPTWKQALDAPGAIQLGILKKVFEARKEWWLLVPDQTIFADGGNTKGTVLNLAARHQDGQWIMVYLGDPAAFSIHRSKLAGGTQARAFWIDPRAGDSAPIGEIPTTGVGQFTTPRGWEDALLILESPRNNSK